MSDNESINASSATTDGAARKADRYAHGSGIGEAWRSRAKENLEDARKILAEHRANKDAYAVREWEGIVWAFGVGIDWFDELEADAATSTHEPGRRCS